MPRLTSKLPGYRRHASGQAFVYLDGRTIYLGPYRSQRSRQEYDRLISEWTANGRRLPTQSEASTTVVEVCAAYLRHAKVYYPKLYHRVIKAIQVVTKLYGRTPANEFSPRSLKACRQSMISEGGSRNYVNRISGQIKYMFKGVSLRRGQIRFPLLGDRKSFEPHANRKTCCCAHLGSDRFFGLRLLKSERRPTFVA